MPNPDGTPTQEEIAEATKATGENTAATVENTNAKLDNINTTNSLGQATGQLGKSITDTTNSIKASILDNKTLSSAYDFYKKSLESMGSANVKFTNSQMMLFGQVSNMITDTTKLYTNLGNVDISRGFIEQYTSITGLVQKTMGAMANATPDVLSQAFRRLGLSIPIDIIGKGAAAIDTYIKAQLNAADAALRLRDNVLANASATGTLGQVYEKSGDDLTSINALLFKQADAMKQASEATNTSSNDVEKYYSQLGKLPGVLDNVVRLTKDGQVQTSMLAGTILLARGAGREYASVIEDMRVALDNYDASGDKAERAIGFVSRMSEVSQKLGIELNQVRGFMQQTSEGLGKFGDNTDATANILNNYVGALRNSGASGKQSIEIVKQMTDGISQMSMAQKALLSARTGGPGGLAGALKIEDMMRKGKTDEIIEMMRKDMTKQFGRTVTMDEAIKDPRLAGQFERQRMMLQKGPYGNMVKSEAEATRMLDMFKELEKGKKPTGLSEQDGLQSLGSNLMNKGRILGEQTMTAPGMAALQLENSSRLSTISGGLEAIQGMLTVSSGSNKFGTTINDPNRQLKENTKMEMLSARDIGAQRAANNISENKTSTLYSEDANLNMKQDFTRKMDFISKNVMDVVKSPFTFLDAMVSDNKKSPKENEAAYQNAIKSEDVRPNPARMIPRPAKDEKNTNTRQAQPVDQESRQKVDVHITGFCLACQTKIQNPNGVNSAAK